PRLQLAISAPFIPGFLGRGERLRRPLVRTAATLDLVHCREIQLVIYSSRAHARGHGSRFLGAATCADTGRAAAILVYCASSRHQL
ncbi:Hypothetical predicted protein, partial [Pelobates cultripes]